MQRAKTLVTATIAAFLAALPAAGVMAQSVAGEVAGDKAVYQQRFAQFLKDPGNFPYAPMEKLSGAKVWRVMTARADAAIDPAALAKGDAYAAAMRSSAFLVWHKGALVHSWYGPGMDAQVPMLSKSLSKPITALAVGRAIALGRIKGLDQPLSEIIPELKGTQKGRILVRHLLDMRSGMLDQGFSPDPAHPLNTAYLSTDHGREIINHYPMIAEPGTRYAYANAPSDMVALVIERATGRRYGEFVGAEVLAKIGAPGGTIWVDREGGLAHSGCCTYLPAETYLRMAMLIHADGVWGGKRLLPKGYTAQMRKGTPQNPNFGLGLWIGEPYHQRRGFGAPGTLGPQVLHSEPYLDPELYLFDGNSNQVVYISPKYDLIVLRIGATPPAPSSTQAEWDNAYLPNLLIQAIKR
ncbi:serine hydrolase domain-containing protein [Novosphingobium sp. SG707]|uniref:serine hydrolase domain-containing protein n=1 Tax=Novosphingobium sp. SG707 TaxID=2586996 RepID=UPI00144705F9|nr:serine hydrolase domain-containing protein [Novosphingobium sp. SG707]NKI98316.1 CubicO group peptidase (beta-lactamase class C family) [Novosphingobium sp. SG707]